MDQRESTVGGRWRRRAVGAVVAPLAVAGLLVVGGAVGPTAAPSLQMASTEDPAPPTNLRIDAGDTRLDVQWNAPAGSSIVGYRV